MLKLKNVLGRVLISSPSNYSRVRLISTTSKQNKQVPSFQGENDYHQSFTHKKISYSTSLSRYPLVFDTIKDLIDARAQDSPDKLLFAFPHQGVNLKFKEAKERVDVVAQNLLRLGFQKGDRVCFLLPNTYELAIAYMAATQIGLISVVLNPAYQLTEIEFMLKKTKAKGLFIYDSFKVLNHLEIIRKLCPEIDNCAPGELNSKNLPSLKSVIVLNSPLNKEKKTYKGTIPYQQVSEKPSSGTKISLPVVEAEDPCLILFTV